MPRVRESAAVARGMVRAALDSWRLACLVDSVTLIVTELVANAAQHARVSETHLHGGTIRVTVSRIEPDRVRVAVVDLDTTELILGVAVTDDEEHGRGLALVDALSVKWGVDALGWGKRVWAEVDAG
ncbi:ATP-binding protein [Streptomyces poriferorum]|uniref:ATP-binding protein n=1 Tax=Streptomyces poriferorum TaxID=2798799 RepID=A0ABY9J0Q9_9ACTN|nr:MULTISPECIES: ATP-binding protein [unclassified Streptomyces]MDP5309397.1 ATP-binding protein [Streptomyces sp. Alt4]WLQ61402.1 ATP-binding protein [Streptomyces sp. Alt2]